MTYDVGNASASDGDAIGSKGAALNHPLAHVTQGQGSRA